MKSKYIFYGFLCLLFLSAQLFNSVEAATQPTTTGKFMKSTLEEAKATYQKFRATENKKYYKRLEEIMDIIDENDISSWYVKGTDEYAQSLYFKLAVLQLLKSATYCLEKDTKTANAVMQDAKKSMEQANKLLVKEGVKPVSLVFK